MIEGHFGYRTDMINNNDDDNNHNNSNNNTKATTTTTTTTYDTKRTIQSIDKHCTNQWLLGDKYKHLFTTTEIK
jgi:hypothetical protein